jgi:predicted MFS family arabinose efflux permease
VETGIDRRLVAVGAVATGVSVANNYYAQPLLPTIGRSLHLGTGTAGLIVTVAQIGYAAGLILLLPLGDLLERRRLCVMLSIVSGLGLFWMAASTSLASLLAAALVVGASTVVAQVLVSYIATLAGPEERGRVVGVVMSGLLLGVLLARTVAGGLAETGTWRVVYWVAGAMMIAQAGVLRWRMAPYREEHRSGYRHLIASVPLLLKEEPILRLRTFYGLCSFGAFSVLWTSIAFLLAHRFHYSSGIIGLFGLAGAGGAGAAVLAGRLSDRGWSTRSTRVTSALLFGSWAILWAGGRNIPVLIVGVVLLDVGVNGLHITNQGEIYRIRPEARSRITAAYMFIYFVGGAAGSVLAATFYSLAGWNGVCAVGAVFGGAAFVLSISPSPFGSNGSGPGTPVGG